MTFTFSLQDREVKLEDKAIRHESIKTRRERIVELEGLLIKYVSHAKDVETRIGPKLFPSNKK
jgi:hypothetical protein